MVTVEKNGIKMTAKDNNQLAAFLNNGWKIKEDIPAGAEVTDDVPDGALDTNADGSVNAYDENGNLVGTVDAETVQKLEESAGEEVKKQTKTKDSKKK